MEENKIDNFINNLLQDREISGNSSRWANWKSMLTLFTCKYCVEHHGMIVDFPSWTINWKWMRTKDASVYTFQ